jgi:hypothetical protein
LVTPSTDVACVVVTKYRPPDTTIHSQIKGLAIIVALEPLIYGNPSTPAYPRGTGETLASGLRKIGYMLFHAGETISTDGVHQLESEGKRMGRGES